MLNKIRESYQNTRPSDDPVLEVMNRLPSNIVEGYLQKINLKHAGVLLGLQPTESGINIIDRNQFVVPDPLAFNQISYPPIHMPCQKHQVTYERIFSCHLGDRAQRFTAGNTK